MPKIPTLTLNTQDKMPLLGLGVYKATGPGEVEHAISTAVEQGYRLIDTASVYKNEDGVGWAIKSLSIPREELFVTTKVWNTAQRLADVDRAFERSLERLQLDYVDLYLIHWPVPGCYLETWKKLEQLKESGRIRNIGVSNFSIEQLENLAQISDIVPAVNQIEYHPLWNRDPLRIYCQEHGIAVQAYAPLARGAYLQHELLQELAQRHNKTTAQIGLRWLTQKGISAIPKSIHDNRIVENANIFDFTLDAEEMEQINSLNENFRCSSIPEDMIGFAE